MSRRKKWLLFGILVLTLGLGTPAVWFKVRSGRPNILFITLDTTRADRLGPFGYKQAKTPCLDRLAAEGIVFENALTHVPLTLPSHATMLTSLYPPEHGLHINAMGKLPPQIETLPEKFSSRDYRKGAFLASFVLDHQFGLDRGFDHYDDDFSGDQTISEAAFERRRQGQAVIDKALTWLEEGLSGWSWVRKPYFCWIHLYDPHTPYAHTAGADKEFDGRPYDAEIAYVDVQLQRLLKTLEQRGQLENTLIVVVGDHGEGLREHEETGHGQQLYQSTLHVPLIFHWPAKFAESGFVSPRRVPEMVGLIDLSPTLLALLGKSPLDKASGRSLLPAFQGKPLDSQRYFAETFEPYYELHSSPQRALIEDRWKYVQSKIPELYNLSLDPHELTNLANSDSERATTMAGVLREMEARMIKATATETIVDEKTLKWLKDIGYTGGKNPPKEDMFQKLPDIKDLLPAFNRISEAMHLRERGNVGDAERLFADIIKQQPALRPARVFYAETLAQQGTAIRDNSAARTEKFEQAIEACQALIARERALGFPENEQTWEAHLILGGSLSELGRHEEAEKAYEDAERIQPENSKVQTQVGMARIRIPSLQAKGIRNLEAAVGIDKELWQAQYELGRIYKAQSRTNDALAKFRLAVQYNPRFLNAYLAIVDILMTREQWADAQAELDRALKAIPNERVLLQLLAICKNMNPRKQ